MNQRLVVYGGDIKPIEIEGLGEMFHVTLWNHSEDGRELDATGTCASKQQAEELVAAWRDPKTHAIVCMGMSLDYAGDDHAPQALDLDQLNDLIAADPCEANNLQEDLADAGADQSALTELLETGSVAVAYGGRRFVLALTITEEP